MVAVPEESRERLIAEYVERLQTILAQRFPPDQGYSHGFEWSTAPCVDPQKHTPEIRARCRAAWLGITRGPKWGISVQVTPKDVHFDSVKILIREAVPIVVGGEGLVLRGAMGLAILSGVVLAGAGLWQTGAVRTSVLGGLLVGTAVLLATAFLGLLLLSPIRFLMSLPLRPEVRSVTSIVDGTWSELQGKVLGLAKLSRRMSPTLGFFLGSLVTSGATLAAYWFSTRPAVGESLAILLVVIACILGFAAFGALLGLIVALLGRLE